MPPTSSEPSRPLDSLDRAIVLTVAVVAGVSAVLLLTPGIEPHLVAPGLDVLLDTVTTLVTIAITVLAWLRYRDRCLPVDLLQTAAFLVLAVANVAGLVVATVQVEPPSTALDQPSEAAAYVFSAARLLTASLLVAGGLTTLAGRTIRRPAVALAGPLVLLIAFVVFVAIAGPILPPATAPADRPRTDTRPEVGEIRPAINRMVVVLPAPFKPVYFPKRRPLAKKLRYLR